MARHKGLANIRGQTDDVDIIIQDWQFQFQFLFPILFLEFIGRFIFRNVVLGSGDRPDKSPVPSTVQAVSVAIFHVLSPVNFVEAVIIVFASSADPSSPIRVPSGGRLRHGECCRMIL